MNSASGGPAGLSTNSARSGVLENVRAISPRVWLTAAAIFGVVIFFIVTGVLDAEKTRQEQAVTPQATATGTPESVLGMIPDRRAEPQTQTPPQDFPLQEEIPAPPAGPTYAEMAFARMYAQEMAAASAPLSGQQGILGQGLDGLGLPNMQGVATQDDDQFAQLESQLQTQLGVLTQRMGGMGSPGGAGVGAGGGTGLGGAGGGGAFAGASDQGVRFEPAPRSPVIHEGWVVPARLDQLITSDISGQVRAIVSEDVYDSVTGRFLLIPAGTKAIGQYGNGIVFGQDRLAVVWTRLILPDGSSLHIDAPGTDGLGSVGLKDRVNNHWGKVLGAALLSTVFSVGVSMANDDEGSVLDRRSNADVARSTAANEVARVGSAITARALTVPPTIEVRPGYALQIRVNRDWYLQPWRRTR